MRIALAWLEWLEEIGIAVLLALVVLAVGASVFTRYVLRDPIQGANEIATIAFVYVVFFGAVVGVRRNLHVGIDTVVELLPPLVRGIIAVIIDAVLVGALIYLTRLSWLFTVTSAVQPTPVMQWSFAVLSAPVAVAFALMILHAARMALVRLRGFGQPPASDTAAEDDREWAEPPWKRLREGAQ